MKDIINSIPAIKCILTIFFLLPFTLISKAQDQIISYSSCSGGAQCAVLNASGGPKGYCTNNVNFPADTRLASCNEQASYCFEQESFEATPTNRNPDLCTFLYSIKAVYEDVCPSGNCNANPKNNPQQCGLNEGNPINVATGNKYQQEIDYVSTQDNGLSFMRYYNSDGAYAGREEYIGTHWRHNYQSQVRVNNLVRKEVIRANGQRFMFALENGTWVSDADVILELEEIASGWRLTDSNDVVEEYDVDGKLLTITNKAGRTKTLQYDIASANGGDDNNDTLDKVIGPFGRELIITYNVHGHIATITTPNNEMYTYSYDAQDNLISVTYPDDTPGDNTDNDVRMYHYEDTNFSFALTGITDETGNRFANWGYDATGRAIFSEHAVGAERVDITYDDTVKTTTVVDALGQTRTYNFTELFDVIKPTQIDTDGACTSCGNHNKSTTYDANGFVASRTDFNDNVTNYINDAEGLELSRTEAVGTPVERTITTTWDTTYRVPLTISEPGQVTTMTYDTDGRLLTRTIEDSATNASRTTTNTYYHATDFGGDTNDARIGLIKNIDGPRVDVTDITTFEYDVEGNLIKTTNALGHETNITSHDGNGRPLTLTDANNTLTSMTYDARGRLESRTVDGEITSLEYNGVGNITKTTLPNGAFLINEYDEAQRLIAVEDNQGNRIEYILDAMGNRTQEDAIDPSGTLVRTMSRTYNSLNRLIETLGGAGQAMTYGYDDNGNQTNITVDPTGLNQVTQQAFDALNRLSTRILPVGEEEIICETPTFCFPNGNIIPYEESFTYDARDNLASVTDAEGLVTQYDYDGLDNLVTQTSPDTGVTSYTYDEANNRLTQMDARGVTTTYTYDALNRLTSMMYPEISVGTPNPQNVTYYYDASPTGGTCTHGIGRLCQVADETGVTEYDYDARGNLISQTQIINSVSYTTSYAYNGADQLTQIVYPSGRSIDYQRNNLGQVASISTTQGINTNTLISNAAYQAFGPLLTHEYGNGLNHTRTYDLDYRVTSLVTTGLQDDSVSYDNANNITRITDNLNNFNDANYQYDDLNRITQGISHYGTEDFSYDSIGNRQTSSLNSVLKNYTYGLDNHHLEQVTNGTSETYSYDAVGNLIQANDNSYIYGDNNRLQTVSQAAEAIADYIYNAQGQRSIKTLVGGDNRALLEQADALEADASIEQQTIDSLQANISTLTQAIPQLNAEAEQQKIEAAGIRASLIEDSETAAALRADATRYTDKATRFSQRAAQLRDKADKLSGWWRWYRRILNHIAKLYDQRAAHFMAKAAPAIQEAERLEENISSQEAIATALEEDADSKQQQVINHQIQIDADTLAISTAEEERDRLLAEAEALRIDAANTPQEVITYYIYGLNGELLSEINPNDGTYIDYIWHEGQPLAQVNNERIYFYHTDHLNTPQQMTDANRQLVWEAQATTFGETTVIINTISNNLRFPGQYYDEETGLHYNWNRYYDPAIGRYITSDPIGLEGGLNTYLYANGNSINERDFYGLTSIPLVDPIIRPVPMSPIDPILPIPDFGDPDNLNPDPFSQECRRLLEKINRTKEEIFEKRYPDLETNPRDLPLRIGPGERLSETVRGHEKLLNRRLRELRKLEDEYLKKCTPMACL